MRSRFRSQSSNPSRQESSDSAPQRDPNGGGRTSALPLSQVLEGGSAEDADTSHGDTGS